ncbi:MAG: hypothetical protein WCI05_17710, partial [Myxococcales bacterium]
MNPTQLALIGLSTLVALQGCKLLKKKDDNRGSSESSPASRPNAPSSQVEAPVAPTPCKLDDRIKTDVTIKRGCVVAVNDDILVEDGAALTLEAGVRL